MHGIRLFPLILALGIPACTGNEAPPPNVMALPGENTGSQAKSLEGSPAPGMAHLRILVVLEENGRPVPKIQVRLLWKTGDTDAGRDFRTTNGDGRCFFEITGGTYVQSLAVAPTQFTAPAAELIKRPILTGDVVDYEFRLSPGGVLSGQVFDADGGPVVGAEIRVWSMGRQALEKKGDKTPDVTAQTHEGGVFTVGGLAAGDFLFEAFAEGMTTVARPGGEVKSGQVLDGFVVRMEPAEPLLGSVLGEEGEPVEAALVVAGMVGRFTKRDPGPVPGTWYYPARQRVLYTDSDGDFLVPAIPISQMWAIEVRHRHYQQKRVSLLPGTTLTEIELLRGWDFSGKVVDAKDTPLSRPFLRLRGVQERERRGQKNGVFQFSGLLTDTEAAVLVYQPGFAPDFAWPLDLTSSQEAFLFRLRPGLPLGGTLVDSSGQPLSGWRLELVETKPSVATAFAPFPGEGPLHTFGLASTQTASDGAFLFLDLPPGEKELKLWPPNGAPFREILAQPGRKNMLLELDLDG